MSIDSFFNAMKKNMQGTIHLSDPPLYVGRMRVEILIVIENSVFENLVCMLTVVENCRKVRLEKKNKADTLIRLLFP